MKNFIQIGDHIDLAHTAAVVSGQAIKIGTKIGVALKDLGANEEGAYRVSGVFSLPKNSADVITPGAALYWDDTNKRLTTTSSSNTYAGWAVAAAAGGATTVVTKINN